MVHVGHSKYFKLVTAGDHRTVIKWCAVKGHFDVQVLLTWQSCSTF